jgi:hypothetical protein
MKRIAPIALALALSPGVGAVSARPMTESDLLDGYLDDLAFAMLLQARCPVMKINPEVVDAGAVINRIGERDIMPGGKYFKKLARHIDRYADMVRGFSEEGACTTAIISYGPEGIGHKNFMVPKVQK